MAVTSRRVRLTKRHIDTLTHPKSGQLFVRDQGLPGFGLRITRGTKTFIVERRVRGRLHRVIIGNYGPLTLDQARQEALPILEKLSKGEALTSSRGEMTFGEFADLYLEKYAIRKKSFPFEKHYLQRHLAPWNNWQLSAISRKDIAFLHAKIGKTRPTNANRVLSLVRTMFKYAVNLGFIHGESPASNISAFPETSRDRFVQPDELPKLFKAMKTEPNPYIKAAILMGLLTGARRSEVLSAKWVDIDLAVGTWRIPQTKSGHWHLLPLPGPLKQILVDLPRVMGNPFLFVGRNGKGHLKNITRGWGRIRVEAGLPDIRIHDLRRTLGSWMAGTGVSLQMIGKILNHRQPNTTAIYSRLNLDPLRAIMEENAERMMLLGGGIEHDHKEECADKA
jgi:integrase